MCIISSLRDGLNLVSYEYAACQEHNHGVLMMSNYVGAAKTLPPSSMVVFNPWDTARFAERINSAMSMDGEERARRYGEIKKVVDGWTRCVVNLFCSLRPPRPPCGVVSDVRIVDCNVTNPTDFDILVPTGAKSSSRP